MGRVAWEDCYILIVENCFVTVIYTFCQTYVFTIVCLESTLKYVIHAVSLVFAMWTWRFVMVVSFSSAMAVILFSGIFAGMSSGVDWKSHCCGRSEEILRGSQSKWWTGLYRWCFSLVYDTIHLVGNAVSFFLSMCLLFWSLLRLLRDCFSHVAHWGEKIVKLVCI